MASYRTKGEVVEVLRHQLSTSPRQALRALLVLFGWQTEEEREGGHTLHSNGLGFSHCDSCILTSFAKQHLNGFALTQRQLECLMSKIPKYAGQLVRHSIASGKIRYEGGRYVW